MSELAHIPLSSIVAGANPRHHFDARAMEELTESVRASGGILQPILVRPFDDGMYQVIAGERRLRAAKAALGEDYLMPAQIIAMDDDEAAMAALTENVVRANMSPAEEAEAAAKLLGEFANDRDETARRLGWSRSMLDRRLALMNATDDVRAALVEGKISLGHAELLAAAEKSKQPRILAGLLGQTPMPSVSQLKAMLAEVAKPLESACFDKTQCLSCPQNSSLQASMFAESISAGSCTGPECYTAKTEEALEQKRLSLVDAWPRVEIMRPGQNYTVIKIKTEGPGAVSEEQAKACGQCKNYGAAISAVPGKEGRVFEGFCFDTPCNTRMVARNLKAQAAEATGAGQEKASGKAGTADGAKAKAAGASKPAAKAAAVTLSSAVVEYRKKLWRKALQAEIGLSADRQLGMLIALAATDKAGKVKASGVTNAIGQVFAARGLAVEGRDSIMTSLSNALDLVAGVTKEMLAAIVLELAATAAQDMEIRDVQTALAKYQTDLACYFRIDAEYLDLLTKAEIQAVATEVGLDKAYGDKFKSLFSEKKPELIKKLLAVQNFDFAVVPKQLLIDTPEKA